MFHLTLLRFSQNIFERIPALQISWPTITNILSSSAMNADFYLYTPARKTGQT